MDTGRERSFALKCMMIRRRGWVGMKGLDEPARLTSLMIATIRSDDCSISAQMK